MGPCGVSLRVHVGRCVGFSLWGCVSVCGKGLGRAILRGSVVCGGISVCLSSCICTCFYTSVFIKYFIISLIISFIINFYPSTKP